MQLKYDLIDFLKISENIYFFETHQRIAPQRLQLGLFSRSHAQAQSY